MKQGCSSNILEGMPSLLGQFPFPQFQNNWPKKRNLPPLPNNNPVSELEAFNLCIKSTDTVGNQFQLRVQKKITKCVHTDKKHYAKNMCYTCYYQNNKQYQVIKCGHTDRIVFARNMCCSCYSIAYKAYKKRKLKPEN